MTDHQAGSSPSYCGWSSSDNECKKNLKDDEDAATTTEEDESPQL
jgi:hypothetical protein